MHWQTARCMRGHRGKKVSGLSPEFVQVPWHVRKNFLHEFFCKSDADTRGSVMTVKKTLWMRPCVTPMLITFLQLRFSRPGFDFWSKWKLKFFALPLSPCEQKCFSKHAILITKSYVVWAKKLTAVQKIIFLPQSDILDEKVTCVRKNKHFAFKWCIRRKSKMCWKNFNFNFLPSSSFFTVF